jgi:predicted nucleotidyltransferase
MNYEADIARLVGHIQIDPDIVGIMLYGSYINGTPFRDIDIALFLKSGLSSKEMTKKRIIYLKDAPDIFDIQIFNLLPLTVQKEILSGKVLYETEQMYDFAYQTIREYEDFEKYIIQYRESALL